MPDAIDVLQRGTALAGGPYLLFSRLGNYLSDAERYVEALAAYEKGLACEPTDVALLGMNRGLVYARMGQNEDALTEYRQIESDIVSRGQEEPIFWHYKASVARVVSDLSRHKDLADLVEPIAAKIFDNDEFEAEKARLAAAYAVSLWRTNEIAASERWLARALELDRNTYQAKWLMREQLASTQDAGGTLYYLTVEGLCPPSMFDDGIAHGFIACFNVIASSKEQALEFATPFIMQDARNSLTILEAEVVDAKHLGPKGVYECHRYVYFDPNGDDHA